ncbi:MAG: hypothetical protein Q4F97_09525 [Bacteroidales bacterium]|nr:hypothetical protein [Bacteroidales bacterium]
MKKLLFIVSSMMLLVACEKENENLKFERPKISFVIDFEDISSTKSGDALCKDLESLKTAAESKTLNAVFTLNGNVETKEISYSEGNGFTVEAFEMAIGEYRISAFEVKIGEEKVYEAVSNESEYKSFVNKTIPVDFNLADTDKFKIKDFVIPVICSNIITPENFGWGAFSFEFYTLYTINYLVFPNENINASLNHTGTLTIQKCTKDENNSWSDVSDALVTSSYNTPGSLPILSFIDALDINDEIEGYRMTFVSAADSDFDYSVSKTFTVAELKEYFTNVGIAPYKYLKISFQDDILNCEVR